MRRTVDFITQLAGEGEAGEKTGHARDRHPPEIEKAQSFAGDIVAAEPGEKLARFRAGDGEPVQPVGAVAIGDAVVRQMLLEPASMHVLGSARAEDEEAILGEPTDGKVAIELAPGRQDG